MRTLHHLRAALVGFSLAAVVAATAVVAAVPAHATTADIDSGGPITRSLIVERALSWADERVPYTQTGYWPAAAPRTGTGHSYRQDCSGFLSMAWDLPTSAVTTDFDSATSAYDTPLSSWSLLEPGDALEISSHVVLFLGWSSIDAGRHEYFDLVSESSPGTPTEVALNQSNQWSYWHQFTPFRYRHVVADARPTASWAPGRTDQVATDSGGHLLARYLTTGAGGPAWTAFGDLTAATGGPPLQSAPTLVTTGASTLEAFGTTVSGALVEYAYAGSWSARTLTAPATVTGISAASTTAGIDLVGRQLGTAADTAGTLVHATVVGGRFSGWAVVPGTPQVNDDPAAARVSTGELDVLAEVGDGSLALGTYTRAGWTWSAPFGGARAVTPAKLAALADGTLVVFIDEGGAFQADARVPGGTFHGFGSVRSAPGILNVPTWASTAAPPVGLAHAALDGWAVTATGGLAHVQYTGTRVWWYVGATN